MSWVSVMATRRSLLAALASAYPENPRYAPRMNIEGPSRSIGKLAGLLGALVGFVTTCGTLAKWASSGSIQHAFIATLPIVGLVGMVVFSQLLRQVYVSVGEPAIISFWYTAWLIRAGTILLAITWIADGSLAPTLIGAAFVLSLPWMFVTYGKATAAAARATRKICEDCAETVKADARVCRYCGWRFLPPPTRASEALERQ
jgi:hypothetical protein